MNRPPPKLDLRRSSSRPPEVGLPMEDRQLEGVLHRLGSRAPEQAWRSSSRLAPRSCCRSSGSSSGIPTPCGLLPLRLRAAPCEALPSAATVSPPGSGLLLHLAARVVRNLCLDWHRRESGRHRVFRAVGALGLLERAVFRCRFRRAVAARDPSLVAVPVPGSPNPSCWLRGARPAVPDPRQLWLLSLPEGGSPHPRGRRRFRAAAAGSGAQPGGGSLLLRAARAPRARASTAARLRGGSWSGSGSRRA